MKKVKKAKPRRKYNDDEDDDMETWVDPGVLLEEGGSLAADSQIFQIISRHFQGVRVVTKQSAVRTYPRPSMHIGVRFGPLKPDR